MSGLDSDLDSSLLRLIGHDANMETKDETGHGSLSLSDPSFGVTGSALIRDNSDPPFAYARASGGDADTVLTLLDSDSPALHQVLGIQDRKGHSVDASV